MRSKLFFTIGLALILPLIDCARILGVLHAPTYSHQVLGLRLLSELADRDHDVTLLTTLKPKEQVKNVRVLEVTVDLKVDEPNMFLQNEQTIGAKMLWLDLIGIFFSDYMLNHTTVQTLLNSNEHFDIVILEQFLNEAFRGFCYHFKAHCIILSTVGPSRWTNAQMGNPSPPSYVPDHLLSFSSNMNFWERTYNSIIYFGAELFTHLYTFRKHNAILQKYFPGAPHLYDLYYNTSLMLLNSHESTNAPVPKVPNMVSIGGYHVKPPKKLSADLQLYLDNAKQGAIYFSMGSNLKSKDMPKEKLHEVLKALSKLEQRVLWKWEDETLPNQPANVKVAKWLPQQDILAHPNVKLFITHGGLLSTIETIYHGVPVVGIPVYGDQEMNMAITEKAGYGIAVPYPKLSEETLGDALNEALTNPKYAENAKRRSRIMHDQPIKPIDSAVFWVEYVLRHDGAPHLRTSALNLTWYQYLLLDVIGFVALALLIGLIVTYKILQLICCRKRSKISKDKKTN